MPSRDPCSQVPKMRTRFPGVRYGSAVNKTPFTMLKIAVVDPMPKARIASTDRVKPGRLRKVRIPKAAVLQGCFEPLSPLHISTFLLNLFDSAEFRQRRLAGVVRHHPGGDVLGDLPLDVKAQLLAEFPLYLSSANQGPQTATHSVEQAHGNTASGHAHDDLDC